MPKIVISTVNPQMNVILKHHKHISVSFEPLERAEDPKIIFHTRKCGLRNVWPQKSLVKGKGFSCCDRRPE